jgi:DNA polymerase-3 subunit delta
MQNKALQKELKSGLSGPLYCLWSEESFLLEDVLPKFTETVIGCNPVDFNMDIFYPSASQQEIMDAALTLPVMAQRRLVVIKDFHQFPKSALKELNAYLLEPNKTTCMLMLSRKAPKFPQGIDCRIYSLNIRDRDIPSWLKKMSADKGLQLTNNAIDHLVDSVGHDIGLLSMEIEKLVLSGCVRIGTKEVISSINITREYTSFELIDAIAAGQKTRAFRILKTILAGNAMYATAVLGALNWHYRQFYDLWINKGRRPLKMKDRTYRTLAKYMPSVNENDFCYIFQSLHEADLGIKTSGRPDIALEVLLIKLLQKGAGN